MHLLHFRTFHIDEEVWSAVREWQWIQQPGWYSDGNLNLCQDGANTSMGLGITLKVIKFQRNKWAAFNYVTTSYLICYLGSHAD
jgi:hypothetical protein